ncbi:MAG: sigma-70 family RNA polymerase sigma factor [Cyclobacteriaceae bacterium]|nr:sigma-70 family RNA polymerase sigma factor [Cyclobacteriaceae bacterium]
MDAREVIEGILQGNDKLLDALYTNYRREFVAWALREFKADQQTAIDIWQDCVVIFYESVIAGRIDTLNSTLKTYLFAIGKNILLKKHKWELRHNEIEETMLEDMSFMEYNWQHEQQEEKIQLVESALSGLGDPCRQILHQYYYQRRSVEEIARSLGYNNSDTAKNMKYKCMQRLKKVLIPA